jgi:preprotein translocase subunit SecB
MAEDQPAGDNAPRFLIKGQYVKDLSFENPHSPHSLIALEEKPRIDVSVELKIQRFNEQHFEVTLHLGARALGKESTLFLLELDYAGIVQFIGIPEDKIEMILHIDCAFVLFPFARRVISDITRDGGFPPLMLEPIDFHALYLQYKQKQKQTATA